MNCTKLIVILYHKKGMHGLHVAFDELMSLIQLGLKYIGLYNVVLCT